MLNKNNCIKAISLFIVAGLLLTACGSANDNTAGNSSSSNNSSILVPVTPDGSDEQTKQEELPTTVDSQSNGNSTEVPVLEKEDAKDEPTETKVTQGMVEALLEKVPQPMLMDMSEDMVADFYHLDPALLEQFTIKMPMMNVKTNEIAILKVKDAKDIPTIEEAVKKRAADVQKNFETYLQDQYTNAKNYKLVVKENYILFVISEDADSLVNEFNSFFE